MDDEILAILINGYVLNLTLLVVQFCYMTYKINRDKFIQNEVYLRSLMVRVSRTHYIKELVYLCLPFGYFLYGLYRLNHFYVTLRDSKDTDTSEYMVAYLESLLKNDDDK